MARRRRIGAVAVVAAGAAIVVLIFASRGPRDGSAVNAGPASESPGLRVGAQEDDAPQLGSLSGFLRSPPDAQLANAWVCAGPMATTSTSDAAPHCTAARNDGSWSIEGLRAGQWRVDAGADGMRAVLWRSADGDSAIELRAGEARSGIDLALDESGLPVSGTVVDITGGPIAGARVEIASLTAGDSAMCIAITDGAGAFRCWAGPGAVIASAASDGYCDAYDYASVPDDSVEILLTPESTIEGTVVVAGTHEAVPDVQVAAYGEDASQRTITDKQGRFRLAKLPPGRYKPSVTAPGLYGQAAESVLLGLAASKTDVTIELHPAASIHGTVASADGPATDCSVELNAPGEHYYDSTDQTGAVSFDAVQPGRYRVTLTCNGEASKPYPDVDVSEQPITVAWEVDRGASISGSVIDEKGVPVAGTNVYVYGAALNRHGGTTDERGHFEIHGLALGEARLEIESDVYPAPASDATVDVGKDDDITIVLPTPGIIEGQVVTPSGAPVAHASAFAQSDTGDRRYVEQARSRGDGTFTLRKVPAGAYHVVAAHESDRDPFSPDSPRGIPVTVEAGATATVRLVLAGRDGVITGQVVDASGAPVPDAFLYSQRESDVGGDAGRASERARWAMGKKPSVTGTDGRFEIGSLSAGTYTVLAYQKGGVEASVHGVPVGHSVTIKLQLGAALSGRVTSSDGPPRNMTITVENQTTHYKRDEAFLSTDGRWAMRDLPAGTYAVHAVAPSGRAVVRGVTLAEGQDRSGIDLAIVPSVVVTGRVVDAVTGAPVAGIHVLVLRRGVEPDYREVMDPALVSDSAGRFRAENVTPGEGIVGLAPGFGRDSPYIMTRRFMDIEGTGTIDIGDVPIRAPRLPPHAERGYLGFSASSDFGPYDPAGITVSSVDKRGPAAAAGLEVGDVITAVDGTDVTGDNGSDFRALVRVPVGTAVSFTLAQGAAVSIIASKTTR